MNPKSRPAEWSTVAGYIALLVAWAVGLEDPDVILALAGVIAFLPVVVTGAVEVIRARG